MKTAAAYIRVSTDDQVEFSPDSQLSRIRDYAKRNDFILPQEFVFIDEGISGRKAEKRPAFMRMIGLAKQKPKQFDTVLLWKFSRFARNREDSIVYKSMLRKQYGIDVVSVSETLGDDKMSILIEALIEAMDEFYSINLAEEVKRGMTEKAKRGGVLSVPAFGYKVENGQFVPVPEEAEIIKTVFERYAAGTPMLRLAKDLNALGVRTHRGGKIENRTIEYWLNNPVYIGKVRWTPTGMTRRNFHNPDSMITDGQHEPLIDRETWDKVQERMKEQKAKYKRYYRPRERISHWLVSMARCGVCGGPLVNCSGYLTCNNRSKGTCRGNGSIKADLLSDVVIGALKHVAESDTFLPVPIRRTAPPQTNINDVVEQQLKKAQTRMQRVKEAYEAGIDTLTEYRDNKAKIAAEIEQLKAQLTPEDVPDPKKDFRKLQHAIKPSIAILTSPHTDAVQKNASAKCFIDEIVKGGADGSAIEIFYHI